MTKFFQGYSFEKKHVEENGHEEDVVICMTEDEYKDKSYREYLELSSVERTKEQLRQKQLPNRDPAKLKALAGMMKERSEYISRQKSEHKKRFF